MNINFTTIDTPLGKMIACATQNGLCLLEFEDRKNFDHQIQSINTAIGGDFIEETNKHLDQVKEELSEYFENKRKDFSVALDLIGTNFQIQTWRELLKIPFGKSISYIQQATALGNPLSVRAVANANSKNKISIIVPCHRVIGANGKLTGYAGGLHRKKWLLNLESYNKDLFD